MSEKKKSKTPTKSAKAPSAASLRKTGSGPMDLGLIEEMVKLMSSNELSTIEIRDGDKRILLRRGPEMVAAAPATYAAPAAAPIVQNAPATTSASTPASTPAQDTDAGLIPIKSPMVGTFYSAASADAKPFVQVGTVVNEETDVAIIEAMKVFNNIKAEVRGTIAKVLVKNAATVEFGTVLFLVKP